MLPQTLSSIAKYFGYTLSDERLVKRASIDSRLVEQGDLFIALKGLRNDAHNHLEEVAKRGALAAIVSLDYNKESFGLLLIKVENTLSALQMLACYYLRKYNPKIIAITGSLGKTTTKDFTYTLLKDRFKVSKTIGNANSQVGVPLTILNSSYESEVLILEMGMSHKGDLSQLISLYPPYLAALIEVAFAHAVNFQSLEDISAAKSEILSASDTKFCLVNQEICGYELIQKNKTASFHTFSTRNIKADFYVQYSLKKLHIYERGELVAMHPFSLLGEHNIQNFLAAYSIARLLGISKEDIISQIPFLELPQKRFEMIHKSGLCFVNDAYNASEKSMLAALKTVYDLPSKGRKIAVLGSMKELGQFSLEMHQNVANYALLVVDTLFIIGDEAYVMHEIWQKEGRTSFFFGQKNVLVDHLKGFIKDGDMILLKGSRSHALESVIEAMDK